MTTKTKSTRLPLSDYEDIEKLAKELSNEMGGVKISVPQMIVIMKKEYKKLQWKKAQ